MLDITVTNGRRRAMLRRMTILAILLTVGAVGCGDRETTTKSSETPATEAGTAAGAGRSADSNVAGDATRSKAAGSQRRSVSSAAQPADRQSTAVPSSNDDAEMHTTKATPDAASALPASEVMPLLVQLSSDAPIERRAASEALDALGVQAIPHVSHALQNGSSAEKLGAATYLVGRVSPRDAAAVGGLIAALGAQDDALRHAALQAVERLPNEPLRRALPALVTLAQNRSEEEAYRSRAVRAIGKLDAEGQEASGALIVLAGEDRDLNLRRSIFFTLTKIASPQDAEAFFARELAGDAPEDLRRLAAKWLGRVAVSKESLAALIHAFADSEKSVRLEAVAAVVEIGKPAVPALIEGLDASDDQIRRHAALTLAKLGPLAADAIPALEQHLDDPDEQVRELVAVALKIVGPR